MLKPNQSVEDKDGSWDWGWGLKIMIIREIGIMFWNVIWNNYLCENIMDSLVGFFNHCGVAGLMKNSTNFGLTSFIYYDAGKKCIGFLQNLSLTSSRLLS